MSQLVSLLQYPEAALMPNKKGKIPLHFAAREGHTEMVRFLLKSDPGTSAVPSKKNKLALHFAAGEGHETIVRLLLELYPQGCLAASSKGKLPLHLAARWGHLEVARALLQLYPDSIRTLDSEGSLPLHDAAREGQVAMAQYLVHKYPGGLMIVNIRGEIPLFPAVRSGNFDLVVALIQAWPQGAKFILKHALNVDCWNADILQLLLRGAVGNFSDCAVLEGREAAPVCYGDAVLLSGGDESDDESSASPYSLTSENSVEPLATETVLSYLCSGSESPCVSKRRAAPQSGRPEKRMRPTRPVVSDPMPMFGLFRALHSALACGANSHVLRHVLTMCSHHELSEPDCYGRLPLHVAMAHCRDEENIDLVLEQILKPYPEAATLTDHDGRLPLHVGLIHRADFRLLKPLLEANPSSGFTPCRLKGQGCKPKLPILMAIESDCDLSTVYVLIRGDPGVLSDIV